MTFAIHGLAVSRGVAIGRAVLVARALAGGTQSIMQVAVTAPQNQQRKNNDQNHHDHSQ